MHIFVRVTRSVPWLCLFMPAGDVTEHENKERNQHCGKLEGEEPWKRDVQKGHAEALEECQGIFKHHGGYSGNWVDTSGSQGAINQTAKESFPEQPKSTCNVFEKRFWWSTDCCNYMQAAVCRGGVWKKPYKCPNCRRRFHYNGNFVRHWRLHEREKPYKCPECGQAFLWRTHLLSHLRMEPNSCPDCGLSFACRKSFQTHQRIHVKERAHTCAKCGKSCLSKNGLTNHQRTHSGEKTVACLDCEKSFACGKTLRQHRRAHMKKRPHKCSACGKSFLSKRCPTNHQRTNTGEKLCACPYCGKSFM